MQRMQWLGGLTLLACLGAGMAATRRPAPALKPASAVGTWKLVTAKANGKAVDVPAGTTVALYQFDRRFTVVAGFHELKSLEPSARIELVRLRLKELPEQTEFLKYVRGLG